MGNRLFTSSKNYECQTVVEDRLLAGPDERVLSDPHRQHVEERAIYNGKAADWNPVYRHSIFTNRMLDVKARKAFPATVALTEAKDGKPELHSLKPVYKIWSTIGNKRQGCSCFAVSPRHALTAGHCVRDGGVNATTVEVYPHLTGQVPDFPEEAVAVRAILPPRVESAARLGPAISDRLADVALLEADDPIFSSYLTPSTEVPRYVAVTGFPGWDDMPYLDPGIEKGPVTPTGEMGQPLVALEPISSGQTASKDDLKALFPAANRRYTAVGEGVGTAGGTEGYAVTSTLWGMSGGCYSSVAEDSTFCGIHTGGSSRFAANRWVSVLHPSVMALYTASVVPALPQGSPLPPAVQAYQHQQQQQASKSQAACIIM